MIPKMYINNEDLKRVAAVLSKIHNVSVEETYMNPGKFLNHDDGELVIVPEFKNKTPVASKK